MGIRKVYKLLSSNYFKMEYPKYRNRMLCEDTPKEIIKDFAFPIICSIVGLAGIGYLCIYGFEERLLDVLFAL